MPPTDSACKNATLSDTPRKLIDAKGLYLFVNKVGRYSRWDYRHAGKRKTMTLGCIRKQDSLRQERPIDAGMQVAVLFGVHPSGAFHDGAVLLVHDGIVGMLDSA